LPFFLEYLYKRMVKAGGHVPVYGPHIVAKLVVPYFAERHTAPFKGAVVFARKDVVGKAFGLDLYLPYFLQYFRSIHPFMINNEQLIIFAWPEALFCWRYGRYGPFAGAFRFMALPRR